MDTHLTREIERKLDTQAVDLGYRLSHRTDKKTEFVHAGVAVYLNRALLRESGAIGWVISPKLENLLPKLRTIAGLTVPEAGDYYHSSNLRSFPKRLNRGKDEIHYGYQVVCAGHEAAAALLRAV